MNFDEYTDRRGTHSTKWDGMEDYLGVSPDDGIAMWVADMDFRSPDCIQQALQQMIDNGNYGYFSGFDEYNAAICWWMQNRHNWTVAPKEIFTTHGLCNAISLILQAFTQPGDGVILFTPVYHAFARVIKAGDRKVVECELARTDTGYEMDFDAYDAQMTGTEKVVILCSPHNPAGRVWTQEELQGVADFCERHDLLLISDEIHHDLVFPGVKHLPMPVAAPEINHRLIMLTAASKTFNIAGIHCGNVIIPDEKLRKQFAAVMSQFSVSPANFGIVAATAAYSPEGALWVDELVKYLDGNRKVFDDRINAIPGLKSMPMQATYLSWVDFSGTGMDLTEVNNRIANTARIGANQGPTFGKGGDNFLRFNIGTQRSRIVEAMDRIEAAFSDLQ
ncbi:MAG: MalY/PatB family protein [Paracoccaceae bacterium]